MGPLRQKIVPAPLRSPWSWTPRKSSPPVPQLRSIVPAPLLRGSNNMIHYEPRAPAAEKLRDPVPASPPPFLAPAQLNLPSKKFHLKWSIGFKWFLPFDLLNTFSNGPNWKPIEMFLNGNHKKPHWNHLKWFQMETIRNHIGTI